VSDAMKILDLIKKEVKVNKNDNKDKNGTNKSNRNSSNKKSVINERVIQDSITKLDPRYLAKNNAVVFNVEVGFIVILIIALSPGIPAEFVR
jgi:potassium-transporting ATPase ATP-binding subunit